MKKLFIVLSLLIVSMTSQAEVMLRTSPVSLLVGAINAEVMFSSGGNLAYGAGGTAWSGTLLDVDFSVTEAHARLDYYFTGAFKQGWFLNAQYSLMNFGLTSEDSDGTEYSGDISGTAFIFGAAYHWQWTSFFMDLGLNIASYSFDSTLELEADNGDTIEESVPAGSSSGIVFDLGWVF